MGKTKAENRDKYYLDFESHNFSKVHERFGFSTKTGQNHCTLLNTGQCTRVIASLGPVDLSCKICPCNTGKYPLPI